MPLLLQLHFPVLGSLNVLAGFTNKCAAFDLRALSESAAHIYQPECSVSFMDVSAIDSCKFPVCPVLLSDQMSTCLSQDGAAHVNHSHTCAASVPATDSMAKLSTPVTNHLETQQPHEACATAQKGEKNRSTNAQADTSHTVYIWKGAGNICKELVSDQR